MRSPEAAAQTAKERQITRKTALEGRAKGRAAKNLQDFWSRRLRQKSRRFLSLAVTKGFTISEILEPLGSPQEAF